MSSAPDGETKTEFAYDYLSRRVSKTVFTRGDADADGTLEWDLTAQRKFVYDGWNMILEFRNDLEPTPPGQPAPPPVVLRKYTWGLDLAALNGGVVSASTRSAVVSASIRSAVVSASSRSGTQGAAGIGGLLAVYDTAGTTASGSGPGGNPLADDRTFLYFHDANGNVAQLVETTGGPGGVNPQDPPGPAYGTLAARYEYDPFGNRSNPAGENEYEQPFRFSTRYYDAETGFYSYVFRYYSPRMGRWVNHDPLDEPGGTNLYKMVLNSPINLVDPLGLEPILWTFSGINNFNNTCGEYEDYVLKALHDRLGVGKATAEGYLVSANPLTNRSECGTTSHYTGSKYVQSICSNSRLDDEARFYADAYHKQGEFCRPCGPRVKIRVMMLSPKTHTRPPKPNNTCCDVLAVVYFDPRDAVPNQHLTGKDNAEFWSEWGRVFRVATKQQCVKSGRDYHNLDGYLQTNPLAERPDPPDPDQLWVSSPTTVATNPLDTIKGWLNDKSVDYVFVCHSQGCNIAMNILERVCKK